MTVEDLLRLKRCERPRADFWAHFEQELRAKQLAAIVEKRPWWAGFSRGLHALSRAPLALGAGVALAVAVVGFHEYRAMGLRSAVGTGASADIPAAIVSGPAGEYVAERGLDSIDRASVSAVVVSAIGHPVARATAAAYREADVSGPSSLRLLEVVSRREGWLDVSEPPSARSIAASLAAVQTAQPEILRNLLSLSQRFDSQLVPDRRPVSEPLARISPTSPERRSRLFGWSPPDGREPGSLGFAGERSHGATSFR